MSVGPHDGCDWRRPIDEKLVERCDVLHSVAGCVDDGGNEREG